MNNGSVIAGPADRVQSARASDRLEGMYASRRGMFEAAAKAIEVGRVDPARFGLTKKQVLDAAEAKPGQLKAALESIGLAPHQRMGLEAIIKLTGRPPLLVRNNAVELQPLDDFPKGTDVKVKAAEPFVPSVGRIEFINHSMAWGGTGWVVDQKDGAHLVLTNRHVAAIIARRAADGRLVFMRSPLTGTRYGAQIDFNEEVGANKGDERVAAATEVVYLADDLAADMALLKVKLAAGAKFKMPDPIPLAAREAANDELVALVGYPAYDTRNDADAMHKYFNDLYEVKRFAPGKVMKQSDHAILSHDCTSLGGNSGSVLLSLDQHAAVGLHFAGLYGESNSAVGVDTIKQLKAGTLVSVGQIPGGEGVEAVADGLHKAEDLSDRNGYDPSFLGDGFPAPWPELPETIKKGLAKPSDALAKRPHELRYTNFGVMFSSDFRLPVLTAVNIDGEQAVRIKRSGDKWFLDGRIDVKRQHTKKGFEDDEIDRGHMVRREDPNWGDDAEQANADTFHYTNAAPQHSRLNQGKQLWQGLENYILDSARTHGFKACVFTAPVLGDDDPVLAEEKIRVPLEFWKVVVMVDQEKNKLHATAYLLSQGQLIRNLLEKRNRSEAVEGFVLGEYRTFQIALADLEEATGYGFGALKDADPLASKEESREAAAAGAPRFVEITTPADLVL